MRRPPPYSGAARVSPSIDDFAALLEDVRFNNINSATSSAEDFHRLGGEATPAALYGMRRYAALLQRAHVAPSAKGGAVTSSSGARDTSSMWGRLTALLQRTTEEGGLTRGQATVAMLVATSLAAATLRARRSSSFRRPSSSAPARGRAKKWAQGLLPWGGTGESKGAETTLGERLTSPRRRRERCTVAQELARIKDFPTFLKDEQQRL